MTRARYRAFKCRLGVHRFAIAGVAHYECRDCRTISIPIQPIAPPYDPIELKVGDVFTIGGRAIFGRTETFRVIAAYPDPMDPTGTLLRRRNVQIGPQGWHADRPR